MNTRRKFIKESTLAATALIAAKPFDGLASLSSPFFAGGSANSVMLLHTNDLLNSFSSSLIEDLSKGGSISGVISAKRNKNNNIVLMDAGNVISEKEDIAAHEKIMLQMKQAGYDAMLPGANELSDQKKLSAIAKKHQLPLVVSNYDITDKELNSANLPYKIIKKGKYKVGVIGIGSKLSNRSGIGYNDPVSKANALASSLKNEMGCNLVVCLSQLGLKNRNRVDDINLAKNSSDVDVIVGARSRTFMQTPMIQLNKKDHEVVINHAGYGGKVLGQIEFQFDDAGKKKGVTFQNLVIGTFDNKWKKDIA